MSDETQNTSVVGKIWEMTAGTVTGVVRGAVVEMGVVKDAVLAPGKGALIGLGEIAMGILHFDPREIAAAINNMVKRALNIATVFVASTVVVAVKAIKPLEACMEAIFGSDGGEEGDGEYLDDETCACNEKKKKGKAAAGEDDEAECSGTSKEMPEKGAGVKPKGCENATGLPRALYTNGILTDKKKACAAMRKIADSRCVEVIGIYNATDGALADIINANQSIEGERFDPASKTLSDTVREFHANGEEVILFAHSEGGLNSIRGLEDAYDRMEHDYGTNYADAAMGNGNTTVYSFGTAETGWPPGPDYFQFTNDMDLVPPVIKTVQKMSRDRRQNRRETPGANVTRINVPMYRPMRPHGIDVYLDALNKRFPVNKPCCSR